MVGNDGDPLNDIVVHVVVVGFHHAHGPEVEFVYPAVSSDHSNAHDIAGIENLPPSWALLPFFALPDGAHTSEEDYNIFTLRHDIPFPTTLFGVACNRQLKAEDLIVRPADVTRSIIQKAVVVLARKPISGPIREKLGVVTRTYFAQRDFTDTSLLKEFYESLRGSFSHGFDENARYLGTSSRNLVHRFGSRVLLIVKALVLEQRILVFGSKTEELCSLQMSLLSLIPKLLEHLDDCGDTQLDSLSSFLKISSNLKSSDRSSLLQYLGLPLQIFTEGAFFSPYLPLQQMYMLEDKDTKSFLVGSSNGLLLQRKDKYADLLVNLDTGSVEILNTKINSTCQLSTADKKWISDIVQAVDESWDEEDTSRPSTNAFRGSEDYIRQQFEIYFTSLLASVKLNDFVRGDGAAAADLVEADKQLSRAFHLLWINAWRTTRNYKIWSGLTDSSIFDIVEPRHPAAGALGGGTFDEMQLNMIQTMHDLNLDQKVASGREVISKTWLSGSSKAKDLADSTSTSWQAWRKRTFGVKPPPQIEQPPEVPVSHSRPLQAWANSSSNP